MTLYVIFCLAGVILLYYGAEWLVKGSSSLARSLGITPVVIGLTVVAFGTSAPELVVSLISSIRGNSMIAVGNVVGSNICNITLVLGLAALFYPVTSHRSIVKRDIPVMLGISFFLIILSLDSRLGRIEGAALFTGIILYTFYNYHIAVKRKGNEAGQEIEEIAFQLEEICFITSRKRQIILILTGTACVVAGAQVVVEAAVRIMNVLGVGEKFIGLTIVAFGTSLPELATSVVAAIRKEMDISLGNIVGSNVFNILSVLGMASLVRPVLIPGGFFESYLVIDYLVMIFTSFLPWLMMRKGLAIKRRHGFILLASYAVYIVYLVIRG